MMDLMPVSVECDDLCSCYAERFSPSLFWDCHQVYFAGIAGICSHSQKWHSSTWLSSSTFTWKALFSSWSTTSKTALLPTMSSTSSTPSTLSLTSSLWFEPLPPKNSIHVPLNSCKRHTLFRVINPLFKFLWSRDFEPRRDIVPLKTTISLNKVA